MDNGIQKKEIAELMDDMDSIEAPEGLALLVDKFKRAIKKALRLGEDAHVVSKRNTALLVLLIVLTVKIDGTGLLELILRLILKGV